MNVQSSSSMMDASAFETRKALILRDGSLPDAPLAMPRQILEVPRTKANDSAASGINRLLGLLSLGIFGQGAGGR